MAKTIKIDKIGQLIDEEPYYMNWFNYDLGGGFGFALNRTGKKHSNRGAIVQGINKDISVQRVMKMANNGDFDEIAGFYPAILLFFGKKFIDKVDFSDTRGNNRVSRLIDNLKGPSRLEADIRDFVKQDFDFIAFLEACGRNEKLNFDVNSAISVYKLQGDGAIFPILCQVFYVNKYCDGVSVALIDDLPVQLPVQVSNYVSGCHFPVAVSPSSNDFKWLENQNGHFLYAKYGGEWRVLDVVGVGRMNLSNYSLANRLNYLGGGGEAVPYLICWNWGEIIDAYHYFGSNLLIRDLKNDIFNHYWFNFGPNSLINVKFENNMINGRKKDAFVSPVQLDLPTRQRLYITLRLNGEFYSYCDKEDVFFSDIEVRDWFELGKMLK